MTTIDFVYFSCSSKSTIIMLLPASLRHYPPSSLTFAFWFIALNASPRLPCWSYWEALVVMVFLCSAHNPGPHLCTLSSSMIINSFLQPSFVWPWVNIDNRKGLVFHIWGWLLIILLRDFLFQLISSGIFALQASHESSWMTSNS